jgi:malate dehydrogenase (oxaloacetate-decarboxylating)
MSQHSASYALQLHVRHADRPEVFTRLITALTEADGAVRSIDCGPPSAGQVERRLAVHCRDAEHCDRVVRQVGQTPDVELLASVDLTFQMHQGGKLETGLKSPLRTQDDLSMAYTPGVARICRAIHARPETSFELTIRRNTVAVVSDGSAVLGLGNIGPRAAMPVMEGKCMLFKTFAGVDAFPICLDTQNVDEIVRACVQLAPTFGGLNLEDISSPRCVEIEQRLIELLDIPVFHDDQHGTAVVVLAALKNALKIVGKRMDNLRVAISGAGAAGAAVCKLLMSVGCRQIVVCDRAGAIGRNRAGDPNPVKSWLAKNTNPENFAGSLAESLAGADVFIGVSGPNLLTAEDIRRMAAKPIVFALANPDPEIDPAAAARHAAIVATGRSDYPNQINNVLCFPGLFRGMFDVRARRVTESIKIAAADAIAAALPEDQLRPERIVPSVFEQGVAIGVARAVAQAALAAGTAAGR